MDCVLLRGLNRQPIVFKKIFLNSPCLVGYRKTIKLPFHIIKFCCRKQKNLQKRNTFKYSMDCVLLRGLNRQPIVFKKIFLNSSCLVEYRKTIKFPFHIIKLCCRKQKYLQKRNTFKYSMYSVLLTGINRHPMCVKVIFFNSAFIGAYNKILNLHFRLLNFCCRKQKYLEKRITFKCSMDSVLLTGSNRHPIGLKNIFLNSPYIGGYRKPINLPFHILKFCCRKQKHLEKRNTLKYSMYSIMLRVFLTTFMKNIIAVNNI